MGGSGCSSPHIPSHAPVSGHFEAILEVKLGRLGEGMGRFEWLFGVSSCPLHPTSHPCFATLLPTLASPCHAPQMLLWRSARASQLLLCRVPNNRVPSNRADGTVHAVPVASPPATELPPPTLTFSVLEETGLKLVNGRGEWSSRFWGPREPSVHPSGTSRMPTFSVATSSVGLPSPFPNFGRGTRPVWRDSFHWDATEGHPQQCPVTALGVSRCFHGNAAAVLCSGECWQNSHPPTVVPR